MKIDLLKIIGLIVLFVTFSGCTPSGNDKVDKFYTEHGEWDSARIPFIKPYEAVIFDEKTGWVMELILLENGNWALGNIRKATVKNGFVFVHTGSTKIRSEDVEESWWIISPSRKIEKGFSNHEEYWACLKTLGFKKEPQLHDMNVIASYYEDNDMMDWNALD